MHALGFVLTNLDELRSMRMGMYGSDDEDDEDEDEDDEDEDEEDDIDYVVGAIDGAEDSDEGPRIQLLDGDEETPKRKAGGSAGTKAKRSKVRTRGDTITWWRESEENGREECRNEERARKTGDGKQESET